MHSTKLKFTKLHTFMPSAEGLIFKNENFGFSLMSKIRLRSYTATGSMAGCFTRRSHKQLFGLLFIRVVHSIERGISRE